MTKLSTAVLACQPDSKFAAAYAAGLFATSLYDNFLAGMNKKLYWEPTFEDALNLIARLPRIAALIFRTTFKDGKIADDDHSLDYSANFSRYAIFFCTASDLVYLCVHCLCVYV